MKKIFMFTALAAATISLSSCLGFDEPGDELNMNQQIVPYETPNSAPIINLAVASFTVTAGETCDVVFNVKDQDGDDFMLSVEDATNCATILSATSTNGRGVVTIAEDKLSMTVSGTRSGADAVLQFVSAAAGTFRVKLVAKDIKSDPEKVNVSDRMLTFTIVEAPAQ